ncbi:hypothetical protein [Halarcobacter ebronensis]|uniref:Uncharacterized protein n=1 Tax=Halarcobacter ebronensis TaxID=1462615 RepID=A0A4Q1ARR2_9BACT|nr:hypothetical protein [Halarcobacter ebronensis]QKF80724.1 hypothetical protein AEBR_0208 [Halarcobacter ebronensis]RXK08517.1 hypothetical protein CRV07_01585 [Halarcobacter ebronensis]
MGILINEMFGKFTQIPNIVISDINIKHTAFRQYCYLLSKPSGWIIRNDDITNSIGISEGTIASNFKNLLNCNYIRRYPCKDKNGKFIGGYDYQIFVVPTESIKNTDSKNTSSGKTIDYNNTKSKKNLSYTLQDAARGLKYLEKVEKSKLTKKFGTGYTQIPKKTKQTAHETVRQRDSMQKDITSHSSHILTSKIVPKN